MRVFVIEEYSEGEFECAGENYKSLVVFDLFKLDELSRDKFKNIMLKKREEKNPEAEFVPENGKSWSFEDIKNEIDVYIEESGKGVRGFERNEYTFDLNNKEEEKKFIELMSSHIKDRNGSTQVDSLYVNVNIKGTEISK